MVVKILCCHRNIPLVEKRVFVVKTAKKVSVFIEIPLTINDKVPFANKQFTVLVPVACKNKDLLCLLALICKPMI